MPLKQIRRAARRGFTKLVSSEKTMKLLATPQAQKVMMKALGMQIAVQERWKSAVAAAARRFDLVTRKDFAQLKRTVRDLESQLKRLQAQPRPESK